MQEPKKIILTGGHAATTALSVIEEIIRRGENTKIYWIGSRKAFEGKNIPSIEAKVFPEKEIEFKPIIMGRLQRRFSLWTIPSMIKLPFGFIHAIYLVLKIKPRVILSFGGFAGFPVVFAGWLLKVPVVVHEQTAAVGRANKLSSYFANEIALSRKSSEKYFEGKKVEVVGNPLMSQILEVKRDKTPNEKSVIYITGGSRGSVVLNKTVKECLDYFLEKYKVIHQAGSLDFEKFKEFKESLSKEKKQNYEIYPIIDPMKIDNVYSEADLVISRAGANTVSEIMALKMPAILIPIPWSYNDEQTENAKFAQKKGIASILKQNDLSEKNLTNLVDRIFQNKKDIEDKMMDFDFDKKASKRLVDMIEKYL